MERESCGDPAPHKPLGRQRLDLMNYDKQRQEMLQDLGADPYVD